MRSFRPALALSLTAFAATAHADPLTSSLAQIAARVMPSVVSIAAMAPATDDSATSNDSGTGGDQGGDNSPQGDNGADSSAFQKTAALASDAAATEIIPPPKIIESFGSGFVFDPRGFIVTNEHVIDNANAVTVTFPDGSVYNAKIVGQDKHADLAVLKVSAGHPLPSLTFGDSNKVAVGDQVLAVGNPLGLNGTATAGIVSALHRQIGDTDFDDFIQTDAAINKGNSGGPLFNSAGEVIGIDSAIESPTGTSDGIGFAIPSAMVAPVARALADHGAMNRGWLGLSIEDLTPAVQRALGLASMAGALVGSVTPGGPSQGVLRAGDVVLALGGVPVANTHDLTIRTAEIEAGTTVPVSFWREGAVHQASLTIAAPPPSLGEAIATPPPETAPPLKLASLGLALSPAPDGAGATVVSANGPAGQAGIVAGDEITQVSGTLVTSPAALAAAVKALGDVPPTFLVNGDDSSGNDPGPRWVPVAP
ncbi:trypsin-like peptidase domain-containing protein [Acidocella sp.]|uniref:trypsin-like peptidase domain-containing protein n=1 Tax=Acidocella sp. TaxID=50710 RepID=UPI0026272203|nr:trypsin-like peptidase domain-containing protein [Acidocella sp.]